MEASVVVPTFNKLPLVLSTLEGLERQDIDPGDFEVIVVDDASSDCTAEALERLKRPYSLRVIRHESNRGRSIARNSAIRAAAGKLIVFLDDDMEVVPGFLSSHIRAHAGNERLAVVGNVSTHARANHSAVSRYLDTRGAQKIRTAGDLPFKYFSTNNSSVLKKHLDAVGCFDDDFLTYGFEDVEIAARLAKNLGMRFVFCEGAASLHLHKHSLEDMLQKKILAGRSSLPLLLRKHPELWPEVGLDMVEHMRFLREPALLSARKMLFQMLSAISFHKVAEPIVRYATFYPLTNALMDFLVLRCYWVGMNRPRSITDLQRSSLK